MNTLIFLNLLMAIIAFMVLVWKRHPLFAAIALFCVCLYAYGIYNAGFNLEELLCKMIMKEENYESSEALPAAYGGWLTLIISSFCLTLYPWFKRWAVIFWIILFVSIGISVGLYSPLSILEGLYAVCVAIMTEVAVMIGLSYLETCTLENIYLHSLLPSIFALPAFLICLQCILKRGKNHSILFILTGIWFLLHLAITFLVWNHYIGFSLTDAGRKCVIELKSISGGTWNGYVLVNILIFIVLFLIDAILSWLLYRYTKRKVDAGISDSSAYDRDLIPSTRDQDKTENVGLPLQRIHMTKRNRLFLGIGCAFVLFPIAFFMFFWTSSGTPTSVPYNDKDDLRKITGVSFPDITLVDSSFIDNFNYQATEMKFIIPKNKDRLRHSLDQACKDDSCCWNKDNRKKEYYYYILPDRPIDRTKGTHKRMVEQDGKIIEDWDGDFIEVRVPFSLDSIFVTEGWAL